MNDYLNRIIASVANLWKKNFRETKQEEVTSHSSDLSQPVEYSKATLHQTPPLVSENASPASVPLTEQVNRFLQSTYDFRYNLLTEETEYRPANGKGLAFTPVGKRDLNTFCLEAHAQGIPCWDKDICRYLYSTRIPSYHPFHLYLDELPVWDGIDRLTPLALRVSTEPIWISGFHRWMLALTAQWMGITGCHANSVAPILVSTTQGCLKSTFCKRLMPNELSRYYSDELELNSRGNVTRKMSEMGLLNLDEFDKYPATKMPLLKNLMQMAELNLCKAYQKNYRNLPRIASFIGTSNRSDLLTDPTGSRRFLCVEVKQKIDCKAIEHSQIYAQLKQALFEGSRYWFTAEEEQALQEHNQSFQRHSLMIDVLHQCFRPATENDPVEIILQLSSAEIFKVLKKENASAMRGVSPNSFSQQLVPSGFSRHRGHYTNYYNVVSLVHPLPHAMPDE